MNENQAADVTEIVLTKCEAQIFEQMAKGLGRTAIARELGLHPSTVKHHITEILAKTTCSNSAEIHAQYLAGSLRHVVNPTSRSPFRKGRECATNQ